MLIAIEGIDGAGKSTQARLLVEWLDENNFGERVRFQEINPPTLLTKWNSSPIVKAAAKLGKKQQQLKPLTFALLEAADLADRYEREILPALAAGAAVVADRWIHTAFARGMGRATDAEWLRQIYSFAPKPNLCFLLDLPVEDALDRILNERKLKYYEAGMDVTGIEDPAESFLEFQSAGQAAYNAVQADEHCFHVIDAALPVQEQQESIRAAVEQALKSVRVSWVQDAA